MSQPFEGLSPSELGGHDGPLAALAEDHFAWAAWLDERGEYDQAFARLEAGNAMKRQLARSDLDPPELRVQRRAQVLGDIQRIFTPQRLAAHGAEGHASKAPIFIVGMPRSGSTLIEQILCSHPKVDGLGETEALTRILAGEYPYGAPSPTPHHFQRVADLYLSQARRDGWKRGARFTDKSLGNFRHVGMIALMFPRATILNTVRDPVDTCFSIYRQSFAAGQASAYDLRDIGLTYQAYRATMALWNRLLPGRVIDVVHEDLVSDPRGRIRWLVTDICGMAWDDRCLRFHDNPRDARSASRDQVRRPMFSTSIGRWRNYERHLGPLLEALGPYAP